MTDACLAYITVALQKRLSTDGVFPMILTPVHANMGTVALTLSVLNMVMCAHNNVTWHSATSSKLSACINVPNTSTVRLKLD